LGIYAKEQDMEDQASKLVALVKADGAAKLAKQQAENAAARARIVADAAARDKLHAFADGLSADEINLYQSDR
jgi:hypothetical protein